jgi:hypothetical protein
MRWFVFFLFPVFISQQSHAALNPSTFLNVTNEVLTDLAGFVGLGADLHAYESANAYSSSYGMDFGASATAIALPGSVTNSLSKLGIPSIPHYLPIAKINIQKAIGPKFILGSEFLPALKIRGTRLEVYGFDLQFRALDRPRVPSVAFRAQYNFADLAFIRAQTYGGDMLTRLKILFVDVYGGGGYRFVSGTISNPTGVSPQNLNLNFSPTISTAHFFMGLSLVAGFARVTTEANLTTQGVNTYGTKLSFFF